MIAIFSHGLYVFEKFDLLHT